MPKLKSFITLKTPSKLSRDVAILMMLKTIKYKGKLVLLLALSKD